jgi:hypothetical protein
VIVDPDRLESREHMIDPNFKSDYETDEDADAEDEEMRTVQ